MDFIRAIKTNPDVKWTSPLINLFKNDFWITPIDQSSSHKSNRPLCVLTFKLNHYFNEFDARGYHLINLIIHSLVCLVFTSIVKRWTYRQSTESTTLDFIDIFDRFLIKPSSALSILSELNLPPLYLIASLLFALHPIHVEAVAGLVGRADTGCALFFLLSLHFYDNYLERLYGSSIDAANDGNNKKFGLLNDSKRRGRQEYREKRLMKRIYQETANTNRSNYWFTDHSYNIIQLYLAIISAIVSMLFKEYGLTVFAVCALYHLITHCNHLRTIYLAYDNNQWSSDRLIGLDFSLRRRWRFYKLTSMDKREDKLCASLQSQKELFKFLILLRFLHAILRHDTFRIVRKAWIHLLLALIVGSSARIWIMGELKAPQFSAADNPTAVHQYALTRTLTFLYLITFNFWLLVCPITLSFDWSMQSIPLVEFNDSRNLATLTFFGALIYFIVKLINYYVQVIDSHFRAYHEPAGYNFEPEDQLSSCSESNYSDELCISEKVNLSSCESSNSESTYHPSYRILSDLNHLSYKQNQMNLRFPISIAKFTQTDICAISIILLVFPFLPATNLFYYVGFVVAERCLYIPSMGFCLLISVALHQARQQLLKLTSLLIAQTSGKTSLGFIRKKANHLDRLSGYSSCINESKHNNRHLVKYLQLFRLLKIRINSPHRFVNWLLNLFIVVLLISYSYRTYLRNSDWKSEETLYRSGIDVNPPKALGNLGSILSRNGFKQEAEMAYLKALEYRENSTDVHYNLGVLLQEQKRYREALASYANAIKYRPRLASAYLNMGYVYNLIGQKQKAIEFYTQCASISGEGLKDPRIHEQSKMSALFNLGKLYADQSGDYRLALQTYQKAIKRDGSHAYYQIHSLYNSIGEAHLNLGEYEQAEKAFLRAFQFKRDHLPLQLNYAKFLQKMNRIKEAELFYQNARSLAPNDTSVLLHFGQFLCDQKKVNQAADIYMEAIKNGLSKNFEFLFNFAHVLRLAKQFHQAEHYYKSAVDLNPKDISGQLNLGAILHLNGKFKEAERHYLIALQLQPNDLIAESNLKKLYKIMNRN